MAYSLEGIKRAAIMNCCGEIDAIRIERDKGPEVAPVLLTDPYDRVAREAWDRCRVNVVTWALNSLETLEDFKALVDWIKTTDFAELPKFEKLSEKNKHFYRLMRLEGRL